MALIHFLQEIAGAVAVDRLMAVLLLGCAVTTALYGWRGARADLRRGAGGIVAVMIFATFLLLRPRDGASLSVVLIVAGGVITGLIIDVFRRGSLHEQSSNAPAGRVWSPAIWLGAAVALLLVFLFADLGGYSGWLMVWEPPVVEGFAEAFCQGKTLPQYFMACLAWNNGMVSNGHLTLLYGVLTYGLWENVGISPLTLRLAAAVLALACLVPVWHLAHRLGSPRIAVTAVIMLSVNPALVFYGRYGTSLSGTLLGVSVAVLLCAQLCDIKVRWWLGLVAGVAAFVATLGYSPGRLVVVAALVLVPVLLFSNRRETSRQNWVAAVLLAAVVVAVCGLESGSGRPLSFFWARGEQIFNFMNEPQKIEEYLGRQVEPQDLTRADRAELAMRVLQRRWPELIRVWSYPFSSEVSVISVVRSDPPRLPLYPPALAVFILWGAMTTLRRPLTGLHPFLLAWGAAVCLPLLLTTRVDVHRLMMTIVPLSAWAAVGVHRAVGVMVACRLPTAVQIGCAALLLVGVAVENGRFLYYRSSPPGRLSTAVLAEIDEIEGPVRLVFATDHRDLGRVELPLLDRQRQSDQRIRVKVSESLRNSLLRDGGSSTTAINRLLVDLEHSSLILAPAEPLREVVAVLGRHGARAVELGPPDARFWRVDRRGSTPGGAGRG